MAKIEPYNLANVSMELENFRDSMSILWNNGKYQIPIVSTAPDWVANNGEFVLFTPGSGGTTQYFFKNNQWISSWSVTV